MIWTAKLLSARELDPEHFTQGKDYQLTDDGRNETYTYHGVPVPMDSLKGTDMVTVLADDKGWRCNVCRNRFPV